MTITPELRAELREEWLRRLETAPPERQGQGALRPSDDTRCCLGEACDLLMEGGFMDGWRWQKMHFQGERLDWFIAHELDRERSALPYPAIDAIGLRGRSGITLSTEAGGRISLAGMNDSGKTWKEIAAFIRANPEKVFK